jgi:hypothetical protein
MPNSASARRNGRLTNLRRLHIHLQKAKASLEATRLFARTLPPSLAFAVTDSEVHNQADFTADFS